MSIHEVLRTALTEAAAALSVPLFWEGEVFTPPMAPHLVGKIVIERAEAASLGTSGFTRTDGVLEVGVTVVSGWGDAEAVLLGIALARHFPRGRSLATDGGEITCMTPVGTQMNYSGRRLTVPLKIPFYAITGATS